MIRSISSLHSKILIATKNPFPLRHYRTFTSATSNSCSCSPAFCAIQPINSYLKDSIDSTASMQIGFSIGMPLMGIAASMLSGDIDLFICFMTVGWPVTMGFCQAGIAIDENEIRKLNASCGKIDK